MGLMRRMGAREAREAAQERTEGRRVKESGVFLCGCTHGALGERDEPGRVVRGKGGDAGEYPKRSMAFVQKYGRRNGAAVRRVFNYVFRTGGSRGAEEQAGAAYQFVGLDKFTVMPRGISSSPSGWARSRTGGGPPSAAEAAEKNLETENDEHGREAKMAR